MSYQLGIDLGTTYTAAAVCRATDRHWDEPDMVNLGGRTPTVASVLYLGSDGSVLVGEAGERRAVTDPDRVVREFKRRIGDETPLVVGDGEQHAAHDLAARLVRWVVDRVAEREGGPAGRVAVTHPASWGPHKKELFGRALSAVGVQATFLAEPQAAALSYASAERVEIGSTIAVYDLGGGTFDAAVVRKVGAGEFELLGRAEGIERLGGVDFDEAVLGHVHGEVGAAIAALDPADEHAISAFARLRRECVEAKEALSADTETTIPVLLPELRTSVRLVRSEFEAMIRGGLEDTVDALRVAITSAGLKPSDLSAVLLVGGSSRIPLVSQMVSAELGRPVAVDADPKSAIAMGAALAISPKQVTAPAAGAAALPAPVVPGPVAPTLPPTASAMPQMPTTPAGQARPVQPPAPPYSTRVAHSAPPPVHNPAPVRHQQPVTAQLPATAPQPPVSRSYDRPLGDRERRRWPVGLLFGGGGILAVAALVTGLLFWGQSEIGVSETGGTVPATTAEPTPAAVPEPTAERPEPAAERPQPTAGSPEPTTGTTEPTTESPEPTTESPEPTLENPAPQEPVVVQPASETEPVVDAAP